MFASAAAVQSVSEFDKFSEDDIDAAFKAVKGLKHHQLLELELSGLHFRLVSAGIGGRSSFCHQACK